MLNFRVQLFTDASVFDWLLDSRSYVHSILSDDLEDLNPAAALRATFLLHQACGNVLSRVQMIDIIAITVALYVR